MRSVVPGQPERDRSGEVNGKTNFSRNDSPRAVRVESGTERSNSEQDCFPKRRDVVVVAAARTREEKFVRAEVNEQLRRATDDVPQLRRARRV
jgi:hypothetical protein